MSRSGARELFRRRVREWAQILGVEARTLYVRPMRRKWASCSTAGTLSFNAELLDFDHRVWDYVIVHELLHFSVPNHGKLWKSLMRAHLGDYEPMEDALRQVASGSAKGRLDGVSRSHIGDAIPLKSPPNPPPSIPRSGGTPAGCG